MSWKFPSISLEARARDSGGVEGSFTTPTAGTVPSRIDPSESPEDFFKSLAVGESLVGKRKGVKTPVENSGPQAHLMCIDVSNLDTGLLCGGRVGKKGLKMCVSEGCTKAAHAVKVKLEERVGEFVFIEVPNTNKSTVFVTPYVAKRSFGKTLTRFLTETRTMESWCAMIQTLQESGTVRQEDEFLALDRQLVKQEKVPATPFKKSQPSSQSTTPSKTDFELVLPPIVEPGLSEDDAIAIGQIRTQWPALINSFKALNEHSTGTDQAMTQLTTTVDENSRVAAVNLLKVKALVGTRPSPYGAASLFELVGLIQAELENHVNSTDPNQIAKLVIGNLDKSPAIGRVTKLTADRVEASLQTALNPTLEALVALYSTLKSPHDKAGPGSALASTVTNLHTRVQELKGDMDQLQRGSASSASAPGAQGSFPTIGTFGGGNFGVHLGPPTLSPGGAHDLEKEVAALRAQTTDALARLKVLETAGVGFSSGILNPGASQKDSTFTGSNVGADRSGAIIQELLSRVEVLEQQITAKSVSMSGISFKSIAEVKQWLSLHSPLKGSMLLFLDAPGLLALATNEDTSTMDVMARESNARRAGHAIAKIGTFLASFSLELPAFFGNSASALTDSKDVRTLPAVKSYSVWDARDSHNGKRYMFNRIITNEQTTLYSSTLPQFVTGEGKLVASACIAESADFLKQLGEWITITYTDLVNNGGDSDLVWRYVSQCVRTIFADLHAARAMGRPPHRESEEASRVMWGCLQCHLKMRKYTAAGFSGHKKLSHILNLHLRDSVATKRQVEALETAVKKAKTTADQALAKAGGKK